MTSNPIESAGTTGTHRRSPEDASRASGSGDLSRTWELELLISGAVVFALLQLPSALDDLYTRTEPHLTRRFLMAALFGYWYVKAILYALIACFLLHLCARAYWVGLIGLDSVYPRGIRWEQIRYGPITKGVYQESLPVLPRTIAKTDNFCSVLFSFAFLIVLLFGITIVFAALTGGAAYLISSLLLDGDHLGTVFRVLTALLLGPTLVISALDKLFEGRMTPDGRLGRGLARVVRLQSRWMLLPAYGPIMMTLFSNVRKKVMYPLFYAIFLGILVIVTAEFLADRDLLSVNGLAYFPDEPGNHSVDFRYYESQRPRGEAYRPNPSIQSDIIRDPFVRLFIPYSPERHNRALATTCPAAEPLQEQGVRLHSPNAHRDTDSASVAVLRCMADLHQVQLNGQPRGDLEFQFYTHPQTGVRGVVSYISVAGLPRGRNLITVQPAPRAPSRRTARAATRPPEPYVIPFWL